MRFSVTLIGTRSLLMHNVRLANPLHPVRQEIEVLTKKRTKTLADHQEIVRLQWLGGIYFDTEAGPYIPAENIEGAMFAGGKLNRKGAALLRGVEIESLVNPIAYDGPRTLDGLWEATEEVNGTTERTYVHMAMTAVSGVRTLRARPRFLEWAVRATGVFDDGMVSLEDIQLSFDNAGAYCGIGDKRPRHGKFVAKVEVAEG